MQRRLTIVEIDDKSCHKIVKFIDQEIVYQCRSVREIAGVAGIGESTLREWRRGRSPQINNVDAMLGALGYRLTVAAINDIEDE